MMFRYLKEQLHLKTLPYDLTNMAFPLVVLNAFFLMFRLDLKLTVVLLIVSSYSVLSRFRTFALSGIDLMVILYMLYLLLTFVFNDYHFDLFYNGMRYEFWAILFFFWGRMKSSSPRQLYTNMQYAVFFASAVGMLLYFYNPHWYAVFRYGNLSADAALDFYRFSSFWGYSYAIAYTGCFANLYSLKCLCMGEKLFFNFVCYATTFFAVLLAQQRVAILAVALGYVFFNFYVFFKKIFDLKHRSILVVFNTMLCLFVVYAFFSYMQGLDSRSMWYIREKIDSMINANELVADRLNMYVSWIDKPFPIFGDGVGRYSHAAVGLHLPVITDCEYLKIIHEKGVLGFVIFCSIQISSLFRAWHHKKNVGFEMAICVFYLIAMVGADPLSLDSLQPWFFWFCLGRIHNKNILKHNMVGGVT